MSLVKTVEMRVLADAGDAQAKLDDLDAKAKDLDGNAIKMRFRLDDGDGNAQLDAIQAKADELGFKDVSIKVRVDGAGRAVAELEAVKHEEDEVRDKGLMDKLFGGGPPLSGGESLGGGIPILGSLLGPMGLAIVPAIEAALVEVTGLVSGFAAAGTGAAAFALLAVPAVDKVKKALTDTPAQLKKLGKLSPDEAGAVTEIRQLEAGFKKMSLAFEPQAFKTFNDALKVARNLLPAVTPFADTFASSLDRLLKQAGKFTESKGFKQFLDSFHGIEGPAIGAIGQGIGRVAGAIGRLLTVMSGKDVAHTINIAFDAIAGGIGIVTHVVHTLMQNWDTASSAFRRTRHDVASAGHDIAHVFDNTRHGAAAASHQVAHVFDGARHGTASFAHGTAHVFDDIRHGAASAGHGVAHVFDGVRSSVAGALGNIGSFVGGHIHHILTSPFAHDVSESLDVLRGFGARAASVISSGAAKIFAPLASAANSALSVLRSVGSKIGSIFSGAFSTAESVVRSAWGKITSATSAGTSQVKGVLSWFGRLGALFGGWLGDVVNRVTTGFGRVVSFVASIPGKINSALGGLPAMMFRAGVHVIDSLLDGIKSMVGSIGSTMAGIASKVAGFFGLSPAKEGPLSAGGAPWIRGQHLVQDIAGGMLSQRSGLASAARQIAGTAAGAAGITGGRGGGGNIEVHFNGLVTNPQDTARQVVQVLKEYKRNGGGATLGIA